MTTLEKTKEKISAVKMRLTVVLTALLALLTFAVPRVSAGPVINGTILELLNAFAGLMPTFLNLIVAVAPVIIVYPYLVSVGDQNCGSHRIYCDVH